eukprot:gene17090-17280_t
MYVKRTYTLLRNIGAPPPQAAVGLRPGELGCGLAAAYRAAGRFKDERTGQVHDFSRRRGVVHSEILAPEDAPEWALDRVQLWNRVEASEKRKDAQVAREINLALPHELNGEERLALLRGYVRDQFVSRGMVADIAIHEPVGAGGLFRTKTREWNADEQLTAWRASWAETQNRALALGGHSVQVDHRSLAAQREAAAKRGDRDQAAALDRQPEIHVGPKARAAARREFPLQSRERVVGGPVQPMDFNRQEQFRVQTFPLSYMRESGFLRVRGEQGATALFRIQSLLVEFREHPLRRGTALDALNCVDLGHFSTAWSKLSTGLAGC